MINGSGTRDWRHGYVAESFFRKNDEYHSSIFSPYNDPSTACPQ